jgi:hypothetical protein
MATYEITTQVDIEDVLDCVAGYEEEDVLLEVLVRFNIKNINAALRKYFKDEYKRVTGYVGYFEEERTLLEILEKFAVHNVNAALREYFGSQTRDKLPDFVDAEKL